MQYFSHLNKQQEQLQINLLQQTHLGSGPGKPSASAIQQLQQQQQQLVAQMQMTQQALMMGNSLDSANKDSSPTSGSGGGLSRARERHMSETFGSTGSSDGSMKENRPDNNNGVKTEVNGGRERHSSGVGSKRCTSPSSSPSGGGGGAGGSSFSSSSSGHSSAPTEKLFSHGHCHWPGCDASCHDLAHFQRHLCEAHLPDDKSTAQTRVQAQIVSQLELQLAKERDRLGAMMRHLNLEMRGGEVKERLRETNLSSLPPPSHSSPLSSYNPYLQDRTPISERRSPPSLPPPPPRSPSPKRMKRDSPERPPLPTFTLPTSLAAGLGPLPPRLGSSLPVLPPSFASLQPNQPSPLSALTAAVRSPLLSTSTPSSPAAPTSPSPANSIGGVGPIRPKPASSLLDTPRTPVPLPLPHGFDERRGRGDRGNPNLDPAMDIKLNRVFYAENDVRPPYTYAALIRYVSFTSPMLFLPLFLNYRF